MRKNLFTTEDTEVHRGKQNEKIIFGFSSVYLCVLWGEEVLISSLARPEGSEWNTREIQFLLRG